MTKLSLFALVPALALAAVYTSSLIVERQEALGAVSRYNIAWLVSQAGLEVLRLQGTVSAALVPGSKVNKDDVQLRLDIVANRAQLFDGGEIIEFVATSPKFEAIVATFRDAVRAGQASMEEPPSQEQLRQVLALTDMLNAPMARLAAAANTYSGMLVEQDQQQLSKLHWLFAALLGALTLCGFGLIGALTWHNRLLTQASEKVEQQHARIFHMAHHDALTGLPNRLLFHERLEKALEQQRRQGDGVALLCLDLDRFKQVNDTLGHPVGDALLKEVAERLRGCLREGDIVARLGGDEFAVLQCGAHYLGQVEDLAQRIVGMLAIPYDLNGDHAVIGASVGIAVATPDLCTADMLLRSADLALYRAKTNGRGAFHLFENGMADQVKARRALELDLREALARDQFEVVYQPLFHLESQRVSGFEALLRWRHPEWGSVSPDKFIFIAEELGLIVGIGEWVLTQACADAATWPEDVKVAINLSPVQFCSSRLLDSVRGAMESSGLPAHRLELEITESVLLQDSDAVLETLRKLRALGLRIALDDFGTGYSSLSYLRRFPFDKLKIDQSFVHDMGERADCCAIVTSVFNLARELGMTTTAEGVETVDQLEQLRRTECTEVQGFLFDYPRPAADIRHWFLPKANWISAVSDKAGQPAFALGVSANDKGMGTTAPLESPVAHRSIVKSRLAS